MGFDNECILNIQSLAGEYFCPVCRLLVYPSEALQSQCTHLYCKPCLSYVVGTTKACPYDGYLVTEADSKPLVESNKSLAETIEKIGVHCLYHRSGCTWQGSLSDCTAHCAGCTFGNSAVVCNRCGTQIVHRQVQEHAQTCPGVQPQQQQPDSGQDATSSAAAAAQQNQMATQAGTRASQAQSTQVAAAVAPASAQEQSKVTTATQPQPAATSAPTPEQWYQQQQQHYQQYYQNYPGYDPYQQQYQHYAPYQQAHPANVQGQQQLQLRPQTQSQQPQPQVQQHPPMQQLPSRPPIQGQPHSQVYPQARPQPQAHQVQLQAQPYMQQRPQVPPSQLQLPQSQPLSHPIPQSQPHMHSHLQPQVPLQPPPNSLAQPHPHHPHAPTPHPPAQAVTGHQSYPQPQPYQKVLPGALPQLPHHIHPQQQPTVMRPPQARAHMQQSQASAMLLPPQGQRPNMLPVQQQPGHPQIHHPGMNTLQHQPAPQQKQQLQAHVPHAQAFPGQTPGLVQNQSHQPGPFLQHQAMQPQIRAQGPPASLQQHNPAAFGVQPHQSQNHAARPMVPNSGVPHQKFQQSTGGTAQAKPGQQNGVQPGSSQNYPLRANTQTQSPSMQVTKKVEPVLETGSQNNDAKEVAPSKELEVAPNRELAGGTKDSSVPNGSQDDRANSLPEERYMKKPEDGYNQPPEERFKPFPGEPNRHIADRREFDEDLRQFPRAGHLEAERFPGYESYSTSRPLDRGQHGNHDVGSKLDGPSGAASRLPPYHSGNLSARPMMPVANPDFLRPYESGRHMPPPRSPGREFPRYVPDGVDGRDSHVFGERYKSYLPSDGSEYQESRYPQLPSHLRRGPHVGADILPSHLRGVEPVGPRHFPNHMHMGEPAGFDPFPDHLRMGGPGHFGPGNLRPDMLGEVGHGRIGDPGYNCGFPFSEHQIDSGYYHTDEESFDQSKKRKQGSMGWCRICKVDCETVEGLEAHSTTRDHQKIAMDIVLSIKKSSAKKHKLSSDDNISHEDTTKSRKGNFDTRGNRH